MGRSINESCRRFFDPEEWAAVHNSKGGFEGMKAEGDCCHNSEWTQKTGSGRGKHSDSPNWGLEKRSYVYTNVQKRNTALVVVNNTNLNHRDFESGQVEPRYCPKMIHQNHSGWPDIDRKPTNQSTRRWWCRAKISTKKASFGPSSVAPPRKNPQSPGKSWDMSLCWPKRGLIWAGRWGRWLTRGSAWTQTRKGTDVCNGSRHVR